MTNNLIEVSEMIQVVKEALVKEVNSIGNVLVIDKSTIPKEEQDDIMRYLQRCKEQNWNVVEYNPSVKILDFNTPIEHTKNLLNVLEELQKIQKLLMADLVK